MFQSKGNNNTQSGKNNQKRGRSEISTDRKDKSVELKGIGDNIIEERHKAELCLKCGKEPYRCFEYDVKSLITNRTVSKTRKKKQKKDDNKKDHKHVKISAVRMVDEYGGRIIELFTDSDRNYDLLK